MMSGARRLYLYGAALFAVGIYQIVQNDLLESSLYFCAALTFVLNGAAGEPSLAPYKRILVISSWIFIAATATLFLYLMQFKF
jgi:hypothetical protein